MNYTKLIVLAVWTLIVGIGVWEVQDWRWQSKQLAAEQEAMAFHNKEASIGNDAAIKFETVKGKTDAKFELLDAAINNQVIRSGAVKCVDAVSLRVLNSALVRTSAAPAGLDRALSRPDPTH